MSRICPKTDELKKAIPTEGQDLTHLDALFKPRSVAIVGVSESKRRGGNAILSRLLENGYTGNHYAVGKSGGEYEGTKIYPSITSLPETPDLIFSAVGLGATQGAMVEAARRGVKTGIIYTAGFAEMDAEGAENQDRIVAECKRHGMRVVGPNCMGVYDGSVKLNLTSIPTDFEGSVGLVSQSGNIALTALTHAKKHSLGFRSFVSFGNQADIPAIDYLEYMADDPAIEIIVFYLESLQEAQGEDFIRRSQRISRKKPIVALKGGTTSAGRRAAESHTARLSAEKEVYEAAFHQAGIVQVEDLDTLLPVTEALLRCPPMMGERIAIVGSGGGHSTAGTDEIEKAGLSVPEFPEETRSKFSAHLPPWAPKSNPLDMTGFYTDDLSLFSTLMRYPLSSDRYDGGLSYGLYGEPFVPDLTDDEGDTWESAAAQFGALQRETGKPLVFYTPFAKDDGPEFTAMREAGSPCFGSLREAAAALKGLRDRGSFLAASEVENVPPLPSANGTLTDGLWPATVALSEGKSLKILKDSGVRTVSQKCVDSLQSAIAAAEEIGYPVVLKAQWEDISHKSDIGGVKLGITDRTGVEAAFKEMQRVSQESFGQDSLEVSVSQQLAFDRELILGIRHDRTFGPVAVLGVGGTLAEVVDRTITVVCPVDFHDLKKVCQHSAIAAFLGSWRGSPAIDLRVLHQYIDALTRCMIRNPNMTSIDVNPLVSHYGELVAVDAAVEITLPEG